MAHHVPELRKKREDGTPRARVGKEGCGARGRGVCGALKKVAWYEVLPIYITYI
jgi:hypothetical protein